MGRGRREGLAGLGASKDRRDGQGVERGGEGGVRVGDWTNFRVRGAPLVEHNFVNCRRVWGGGGGRGVNVSPLVVRLVPGLFIRLRRKSWLRLNARTPRRLDEATHYGDDRLMLYDSSNGERSLSSLWS